jgi:hypothetical protein
MPLGLHDVTVPGMRCSEFSSSGGGMTPRNGVPAVEAEMYCTVLRIGKVKPHMILGLGTIMLSPNGETWTRRSSNNLKEATCPKPLMAGVFVSFELSSNQPRRGCISRSTVVIHLASTVPQDLMSGSTDLCKEARYLHKYSPQWSHRLFRSTNRNPFQPNFPALRLLRNVGAVGRGFQDSDSRICWWCFETFCQRHLISKWLMSYKNSRWRECPI